MKLIDTSNVSLILGLFSFFLILKISYERIGDYYETQNYPRDGLNVFLLSVALSLFSSFIILVLYTRARMHIEKNETLDEPFDDNVEE